MRLIIVLIAAFLTSCSSSTYHGTSPVTEGKRGDVLIPQGEYDEFSPQLVQTLARNGFRPVTSGEALYSVDIYVGGGFGISSIITMKKAGIPIITAKASNPGMGTWLARGAVKRGLFNSSLQKFESQLSKLP